MPTDEELRASNIDIARRYLDAINTWDFAVKRELLSEHIVFEMRYAPPGFNRRMEGIEEVMAFLETIPSLIETEGLYDFRLETYHSDPGEVIAEYKSDMKMVIPVELRNEYVTRFTIRDGKITHFCEFFDPIPLVVALGGRVEPATIESARSAHAAGA
ncbi:ketosteroid isomerase-like protein [Rhodococcus wratislaviensis]|uniref:Ketosteroid isomerase-related protein n=1 Tax=Rhodococcus wratislaviensis TaxID=44752 RepID=A0AB38FG36_RHOWR|nr:MULTISPECIES: nuclear transport factor 2 family protein [Rhodococcus]REE71531.1 ketosteroid isomerase-like protein [Rhodococcus wratislaviensis]WAM15486.1 nuclear transport factor 2 family protein [Rhodococcus sp. JS3073]SPZ40467.1 Ketosteroid isomerase-related protein [Rhodococcus wratislaviensis]